MKKLFAILIAVTVFTAASYAQTNTVSSANVVGYNQITIPSNQFVLVSLGFNNEGNTISNLFGSLPAGSKVYFWNTGAQSYTTISKSLAGWGASGTNIITIGRGAFVQLPANVQTNVYFSGDVPTAETTTVNKVNGYALVAYPYPVDTAFTNTALAKNASVGDKISIWSNGWVTYSKGLSGWGAATNLTIKIGEAFFYQAKTNASVNEVKPYTLD